MSNFFPLFCLYLFLAKIECAPIIDYRQLWSKTTLFYSIIKPSKNLSLNDTRTAFRYAFDQFSAVIFKQFYEQQFSNALMYPADINILFESIDSTNGIGHIMALSSNDRIYFDENEKWKKYNIGEKVDPKQPDITWGAMNEIRNLFRSNNVTSASNISLSPNYFDSNGNYVFPRFSQLFRNSTQLIG